MDGSSAADQAELCYNVTDFESDDSPDLPDRWDKGLRKLRAYVPPNLFKPSLLEIFYADNIERQTKDQSSLSRSSLKTLDKQLTYGDFIEMCDLEEHYASKVHSLDMYAGYVVRHKKIVLNLNKLYNRWTIGLRYHLKVRTVFFDTGRELSQRSRERQSFRTK